MEKITGERVRTAETTIAILETLTDAPDPLGATEIARIVDVSKGTTYKHLQTLRAYGYVEKNERKYILSLRFLDAGEHVRRDTEIVELVAEYVDQLVNMTDETAGFVLERADRAMDIYYAAGGEATPPCTTRHLYSSAAGKALLAERTPDAVREYVSNHELRPLTENTLAEEAELVNEIQRVRERGLAFEREEQFEGVNSVATSVTADVCTGAIYVSGSASTLSGKRFEENVAGILLSIARTMSSEL
jgi:DNA-binding IclR family transcriptional regulator